ncbi:MAG: hemolysin, partial [Candidatus Rokuibacteriota bacterium]
MDNGSTDPDNDSFTLSQTPSGPYVLGTTGVSLTITDQNGQAASCSANVTVVDQQKPNIACPSPVVECAGPSGASVALNPIVSDNCPGVTQVCAPTSGSTFGLGTTPFS